MHSQRVMSSSAKGGVRAVIAAAKMTSASDIRQALSEMGPKVVLIDIDHLFFSVSGRARCHR